MSVFHLQADTLFADPNMGLDAVYRPQAGGTIACRAVIADQGSHVGPLEGFAVQTERLTVLVTIAAVPNVAEGDAIDLPLGTNGSMLTHTVAGTSRDEVGVCWELSLDLQ
jgi:hypothetical protein